METDCEIIQKKAGLPLSLQNDYHDIRNYYDVAGPDYETWSRNFNMHFGYCKSFTDIFHLEKMLVNMNEEVLKQLLINADKEATIADLGCGVGTVARHAAKKFPLATITGITISDYQIEKGKSLVKTEKLDASVFIVKNNFEKLGFATGSFTHAYALESACHANGSGKELFIAEMARLLQPGGRFCIADGLFKHNNKLPRLFLYLYN